MHSGMRGGPHVGALRRCSFAKYGEVILRSLTSTSRKPTCWLASDRSLRCHVSRPRCNFALRPECCQGAPLTNLRYVVCQRVTAKLFSFLFFCSDRHASERIGLCRSAT